LEALWQGRVGIQRVIKILACLADTRRNKRILQEGIIFFFKEVSTSESQVGTEEFTYGLSNGESGNKRKDSEGFHDGEGKGRGSSGERATEFVWIKSLRTTTVERRRKGAVKEGRRSR
jgi:hypothetical protein